MVVRDHQPHRIVAERGGEDRAQRQRRFVRAPRILLQGDELLAGIELKHHELLPGAIGKARLEQIGGMAGSGDVHCPHLPR